MEANKETALRLWKTRYGRRQKAKDFSGRTMAKAAYGDRNSEFGWNLDHILPQSKGGKTADYNLICCNIKTNDEKANKFPCFKANGQRYEILRRQNHYEIHSSNKRVHNHYVNFLDVGQTLDFIEKVEDDIYSEEDTDELFVGYVKVIVNSSERDRELEKVLYEFLNELFEYPVLITSNWNGYTGNIKFIVLDFNIPKQKDVRNMLDKCIILNTYIKYYFYEMYNCKIKIICGMKCYDSKYEISISNLKSIIDDNFPDFNCLYMIMPISKPTLIVDELIANNANIDNIPNNIELLEEIHSCSSGYITNNIFYTYDCIFKKVKRNLNKMISDRYE